MFFLLIVDAITSHSSAWARPCSGLFKIGSTMTRTLGVEWEFSAVLFDLAREGMDSVTEFFGAQTSGVEAIHNSHFRELFGFFGRTESGAWVENFIPERVVHSDRYRQLRRNLQFEEVKTPGGVRIVIPSSLNAEQFGILMRGLMESRGKHHSDLKMRKRPDVWRDKQTELDQLIPTEVAEEWRVYSGQDVYVGFEFPSAKPIVGRHEILRYLRNLWVRLGIFKAHNSQIEKALESAVGHVHWVPGISALSKERRKEVYEAVVRFWGNRNDQIEIAELNVFGERLNAEGIVTIERDDITRVGHEIEMVFREKYSVRILTQEIFNRIWVSEDGIYISRRESDLDPRVDRNIPPDFKRLPFGLRGLYGKTLVRGEGPVSVIGLEARNMPTLRENLEALPKDRKNSSMVDLDSLLALNSQRGSRGVLSNNEALLEAARSHRLDAEIIKDFNRTIPLEDRYNWPLEQMRGLVFIALTDWISHPLVRETLGKMGVAERSQAIERFRRSRERTIGRMNQLAEARQNPDAIYEPWVNYKGERYGGHNIVDPTLRIAALEDPKLGPFAAPYKHMADHWFKRILFTEALKFVSEAGLADLLGQP